MANDMSRAYLAEKRLSLGILNHLLATKTCSAINWGGFSQQSEEEESKSRDIGVDMGTLMGLKFECTTRG
jgi:hypothetical protein